MFFVGRKLSLSQLLMVIFVPLAVVPMLAAMTYSYFAYTSGMRTEATRRGRLEIDQFVQVLQNRLIQAFSQSSAHARHGPLIYSVLSGSQQQVSEQLSELKRTSVADWMVIFNLEGQLVASAGEEPQTTLPGAALSSIRKRQRIVREGPRGSDRLEVVLFEPVISPVGRLIGVYAEGISVSQKWMVSLGKKISSNLILLSAEKKVLASSSVDFVRARIESAWPTGQFRFQDEVFDLSGVLYQFQPLRMASDKPIGYIGVAEPLDGVREVLKDNFLWILSLSVAAVLVIIVITLLATRRITRPLQALVQATRDLPYSHYVEDLPPSDTSDMQELMNSFSEMARTVTSTKKMLEDKLQELQHANQSIRNAQGQLIHSAKMVGLGQLVAGVAHELNNPIGFIHANMFHLEEYCRTLFRYIDHLEKKARDPRAREEMEIEFIQTDLFDLIHSCQDGAKRTKDIVQGLKSFSRIDEAQLKEVDLHEGIQNTLKILRSELKRAEVRLNFSNELPKVSCYASQINQVWMNLLTNAAHSLPAKGGVITVSTAYLNGAVQVTIADTGRGIPGEDMDKIFEPFFTTKEVGQGTGLGLSICYNVVQKHGGTIAVSSKVGKGTAFTVTLPLRPPQAQTG